MNNIPELNKLFNIEETKNENLPVIMPSQSLELDKEDD